MKLSFRRNGILNHAHGFYVGSSKPTNPEGSGPLLLLKIFLCFFGRFFPMKFRQPIIGNVYPSKWKKLFRNKKAWRSRILIFHSLTLRQKRRLKNPQKGKCAYLAGWPWEAIKRRLNLARDLIIISRLRLGSRRTIAVCWLSVEYSPFTPISRTSINPTSVFTASTTAR